jgi:hypothetical protein
MNADASAPRDDAQAIESSIIAAIEQLPGVTSASVWLTDPRRLRSLHVFASRAANPKIIAHAAAKILRRGNVAFDMGSIRIATRGETEPAEPARISVGAWASRYLLLDDLAVERAGSKVTCRVTLKREVDRFEGEAVELDTDAGRVRAAARATLAAAEHAGHDLALGLEGTIIVDLFGRRYIAASVEAAVDRRFALLAGLVAIDPGRSAEETACLAALSAIDRWIAW